MILCQHLKQKLGNRLSNGLIDFFFFQAEDGIRDGHVTGVQTCALPIYLFQAERLVLLDMTRTDNMQTLVKNNKMKSKFLIFTLWFMKISLFMNILMNKFI